MTSLMGWCMDGHHDECRTELIQWGGLGNYHRCGCKCHPAVDQAHIDAFIAANKTGDLPPDGKVRSTKRRTTTKVVGGVALRKPKNATDVKPTRNRKAEAEAKAAADAALAAIEADESVRERMTELMEGLVEQRSKEARG
jgi:hypothetical protein